MQAASAQTERYAADVVLVRRVVDGDKDAAELLRAQAHGILRHCVRRGTRRWPGVEVDAEDLEQSIFLMLLQDDARVLRSYGGRSKFTSWLHTVASRAVTRTMRNLAKEQDKLLDAPGAIDAQQSSADGPERAEDRRRRDERVRGVLDELPKRDRLLLQLLVDEEVPAPRVAAMLGTSPDGVRMKKMRLLRKLSKKLKGLWP